jgi:hypothetical protein
MALTTGNLIQGNANTPVGATDAGIAAVRSVPDVTGFSWVKRVRADTIAGADGASVSSWALSQGTGAAFTGGGQILKTAANGINNRSVVRFQSGDSTWLTSSNGGASLTGPSWYAAAVCRVNDLSGVVQAIWAFGSNNNGQRRFLYKNFIANWSYGTGGTNIDTQTAVTANAAVLVEVRFAATVATVWVNGVFAGSASTNNDAYSDNAIYLGRSLGSGETLRGDIAEFAIGGFTPTDAQLAAYRQYVADYYGIAVEGTVSEPVLAIGDASGSVGGPVTGVGMNGTTFVVSPATPLVIGGSTVLLAGGTGLPPTYPASLSVYSSLVAFARNSGHLLYNDWFGQNVCQVFNANAGGFSAFAFMKPAVGIVDGNEGGAVGVAPAKPASVGTPWPWGGPNGSMYIECADLLGSTYYGDGRIVQTKLNSVLLRWRLRGDSRNQFEEYDASWTEPAVDAPSPGLVSLRGAVAVSVANNGTLDSNITTGAGRCGLVVVSDRTNARCALYRLQNTTLTSISSDAIFSTTAGQASVVSVYANSGQIRLENKTGGALLLTASFHT